MHGDGTTTAAKKGGDNLGYNGHKHFKGEKIVALVDRNCNVIAPFTTAPGNKHEGKLFADAFEHAKRILKNINNSLKNIVVSLDSAYDSFEIRKQILRGYLCYDQRNYLYQATLLDFQLTFNCNNKNN